MSEDFIRSHARGVLLTLRIQPRSSRDRVEWTGQNGPRMWVKAPPVDSAANKACLRLLAENLGVSRNALSLHSGQTSRTKTILVDGMTPDEIRELISTGRTGETD